MNKIRFGLYRERVAGGEEAASRVDLERPDLAVMRATDNLVKYMASKEIVADIIALRRAHVNEMEIEQAKTWMRYLVARYGAYPNVIWCLTNEWEYSNKPKPFWSELGRFVSTEDPWTQSGRNVRGLSVHQQTRFDWQMLEQQWFSHAIIQLGVRNRGRIQRGGDEWKQAGNDSKEVMRHGDDWGYFGIEYNWGHNYPVVNDEYGYIGEPRDVTEPLKPDGSNQRYTREKHRRTMWDIYLAGGYGSAGDKNEYPEGKPYITPAFWRDTPEWGDVKRLIDFFTTKGFEWWKMGPRQDLVNSGERVYALAEPASQYIVYAAAGGQFALDLAPGSYVARRYNPRTAEETPLGSHHGPGVVKLETPLGQDWVVYLKRRSER